MAFDSLADETGHILTKRFNKAFKNVRAASEEDVTQEPISGDIWEEFWNQFDVEGDGKINKE